MILTIVCAGLITKIPNWLIWWVT